MSGVATAESESSTPVAPDAAPAPPPPDERKAIAAITHVPAPPTAEEIARTREEAQTRALLNQQTAIVFRLYAKEQHPTDPNKQDELVEQLQAQHHQQYVTQVLPALQRHQHEQRRQLAIVARTRARQATAAADGDPDAGAPASHDGSPKTGGGSGGHETVSLTVVDESVATVGEHGGLVPVRRAQDEAERPVDERDEKEIEQFEAQIILEPIVPASLWTRKDIQEFKQQVLKKSRECCIKLGSLSMATVRVPTRADANAVFWEFATDHYDLAFGVQFEWLLEPPESITVQHHDPEDEEDDDAPANEGQPAPPADGATSGSSNNANPEGGGQPADPEKGRSAREGKTPIDELIPTYRRESHEEVYCGSHAFPGRGVYHLKFDNSYSLWRGKWLYYRVYYSK